MKRGFTLVEIMVVLVLMSLLAAIAIPSYMRSRQRSQTEACINNLVEIEGAKDRYAIENNKLTGDIVTPTDLAPYFLKHWKECPGGGTYTINPIGTDPICSLGGDHHM